MLNQEQQMVSWVSQEEHDKNFAPWQLLDGVVRQWAALSGHERDQSNYQKMKEQYQ